MSNPLSWLKKPIKNEYTSIAMITILHTFLDLVGIIYAILFKHLLDSAVEGMLEDLKKYVFLFLTVLLLQNILNAIQRSLKERTSIRIEKTIKETVLRNIMCRDYSYISAVHSGEWMNKINNDAGVVTRNIVNLIPNFCGIFIHLIVSLIVLSAMIPDFMIIMFFIIAFAFVLEFFFYRRIRVMHKTVQEKDGMVRMFIQECLNSLIAIKTYVKEEKKLGEFAFYLDDYASARIKRNNFYVLLNFFFGTGINGMLMLSALYCAYEIVNGRISYGSFLAVVQIVSQMRSPLANAYTSIPSYYAMIGSIERLKEVEDYPLDIDNTMSNELNEFDLIELKNICFEYEDQERNDFSFDDLSLSVEKGDFIGISGPSGSGKSTLFKLLLNLYKPTSGSITIKAKGHDYVLDSRWRTLYAYVPQDIQLMKGTIKEVICFGEEFDEKKMNESLRLSCCDEFISEMPEGINTELKEKGNGLSEGQMQRIAIARALYSDRPVLLLDEVTSSLNEELEKEILDNIRNMTDKTILLATHHKKALEYADEVIRCQEREGKYQWVIL